jgi:hypothetical protein
MTDLKRRSSVRTTSTLTANVALIGALVSSGLALAQPAGVWDAINPSTPAHALGCLDQRWV